MFEVKLKIVNVRTKDSMTKKMNCPMLQNPNAFVFCLKAQADRFLVNWLDLKYASIYLKYPLTVIISIIWEF